MTGLACPVSTPPRPSPSHHTPSAQPTEAASASLTAGRHAMPRARASWIVANTALAATLCRSTSPAFHRIGRAITAGLPWAAVASIWPNALVNMTDWNCKMASNSHAVPRASCSRRRPSSRSRSPAARARAAAALSRAAARETASGGTAISLTWPVLLALVLLVAAASSPARKLSRPPQFRRAKKASAALVNPFVSTGAHYGKGKWRALMVASRKGAESDITMIAAGQSRADGYLPQLWINPARVSGKPPGGIGDNGRGVFPVPIPGM